MFEAVEDPGREHAELERALADPAVHADQAKARRLNQRYAELTAVLRDLRDWKQAGDDLEAARELAEDDASPPRSRARASARGARRAAAQHLLVPRDPSDDKDVILEIKAGEGGEESALFAGDLLRMYLRYAERSGWKTEILDATESELGGYKDVTRRGEGQGHAGAGEALGAAEVRGRRAPRAAGAGDRVAGPHPHLRGRRARAARGRGGRGRDRPERPPHRRLPLVRPRRPERQHHRLGRAHHPPADRHRRSLPEREEPAAEQGAAMRILRARLLAAAQEAADAEAADARQPGAHRRPLRAGPHLQLPGEPHLRPPRRLQGVQPGPGARRRPRRGDPASPSTRTSPRGSPASRAQRERSAPLAARDAEAALAEAGVPSPRVDAEELRRTSGDAAPLLLVAARPNDLQRALVPGARSRRRTRASRCSTSPGRPPSGTSTSRSARACSSRARRPSCWPDGRSSRPRAGRRRAGRRRPVHRVRRDRAGDRARGGRRPRPRRRARRAGVRWAQRNLAGHRVSTCAWRRGRRLRRPRRPGRRRGVATRPTSRSTRGRASRPRCVTTTRRSRCGAATTASTRCGCRDDGLAAAEARRSGGRRARRRPGRVGTRRVRRGTRPVGRRPRPP